MTFFDALNKDVQQFVGKDRQQKAIEIKNIFKKELIFAGKMKYDETMLRQALHNIRVQLNSVKK